MESQDLVTALDASQGLKDLVASDERGELTLADLWTGLRLELEGGPDREVRVRAALVQNGEARTAFLSEAAPATRYFPLKVRAGTFEPRGPGVFDEAGTLIPNPDSWIPGDAFFDGNGWFPQPDEWIPQPDSWGINGIIDGIYEPAGGPGAGKAVADGPRLLPAVVPADGPADRARSPVPARTAWAPFWCSSRSGRPRAEPRAYTPTASPDPAGSPASSTAVSSPAPSPYVRST